MNSYLEIIKKVDKQGRLVLPKEWRDRYVRNGKVLLRIEGEKIIIRPYKLVRLSKFFDSIEVDIKSDLSDWKSVRRELIATR